MEQGHKEEVKERQWLLAWQTAFLLAPWSKKPVLPVELMGDEAKTPKKTKDEIAAEKRFLKRHFKDAFKKWHLGTTD